MRRERPRRAVVHAAFVVALAVVALGRFHAALLSPTPLPDERVYLTGFRDFAAGESPYRPSPDGRGFYYPPTFARLGAAALAAGGAELVLGALRAANLLGLAATLWLACRLTSLHARGSFVVASFYVLVAPPALAHGFSSGNLSFAVVGAILVALLAWPRHPWGAGLLLGASALVKPIAPVGLAALAAQRTMEPGQRQVLAGGVGLVFAAVFVASTPHLGAYLAAGRSLEDWPLRRSLSLYRWLELTGLPVTPLAVVAASALATTLWARRQPLSPRRFAVVAIAGMTLATPALWSHSLLLTLPLQAMAIDLAARRRRAAVSAVAARRRYELVLVVLAALALQLADGIGGGVETSPATLQLLSLTVPVFAPLALAVYLWRHDEAVDSGRPPEAA